MEPIMQPDLGIVLLFSAGLANGSFAVPSKRITRWSWNHIWLVYCCCALGAMPLLLAAVFAPGVLWRVIPENLQQAALVAGCGALWGFGTLLFGISLPRLGIAISNALVSGTALLMGSIGPLLVGAAALDQRGLLRLFQGLLVLMTGIILCALASIVRDRNRPQTLLTERRGKPLAGVLLAVTGGILSSMLNVGFAYGAGLGARARTFGYTPLLANLAIWAPLLFGGLLVNLAYMTWSIQREHGWRSYLVAASWPGDWLRSACMAMLWLGAILLYGAGASLAGPSGAVYGWALTGGVSIFTSSAWGVQTGEWQGAPRRALSLMLAGSLLLVVSFVLLAWFNAA
ncbi:MAG: L-rhamnose/proton symporter RhaT [Bryobacteraceae bacterium]